MIVADIGKVEALLRKYNILLSRSVNNSIDSAHTYSVVMECCSVKFRKVFGDISILKLYCQTVLDINLYMVITPHTYDILVDWLEVGRV